MTDTLTTAVVIIVAVGYLIYRQMQPHPLSEREVVLMPLVLAFFTLRSITTATLTPSAIVMLVAFAVIGVIFGALSCRSLHVYADAATHTAMLRADWTYFIWWGGSLVVRAIVVGGMLLISKSDRSAFGSTGSLLLSATAMIAIRSYYLYNRAQSMGLALAQKTRSR